MTSIRPFFAGILVSTLLLAAISEALPARAQSGNVADTVNRIRDEISDRNDRLKEIEAEIAKFQSELQKVGAEKETLQKAINQLELERKKVTSDINYTENRIGATDLEIQKLDLEIETTQEDISESRGAIGEMLRRTNEIDEISLVEAILSEEDFSAFWTMFDEMSTVRTVLGEKVKGLSELERILDGQMSENRIKRGELVELRTQYEGQREVLEVNKSEKNQLLTKTKSEEASYQALLAEKKAAQEQILKELRAFEAELQFVLDPTTIPAAGTAVFRWPLESVRITQYFGGTEFAKQNASIYAGRPYHPGIDLGAPRGTKISAPLSGTVRAVGNTDAFPGCYSWGKWTLIDHANGLSTLYAHQDVISVSPGQQVATGDVIGFTGNTGYSTGPHLHFTVYAKEGVSIRKFSDIKTVTSCGAATTPVAASDAYLDPMLYLPAL